MRFNALFKYLLWFSALAVVIGIYLAPQIHLVSFYEELLFKKQVKAKSLDLALESMYKILEKDSEWPQVHSNLGLLFSQLQKKEDAEKSFIESLKMLEVKKAQLRPQDLFTVYYNLGVHFGEAKKIEQALKFYQEALEIDPTSKETKHNIELLIQQNKNQQGQGEGQDQNSSNDPNKDKKNQDQDKDKDKKDQQNQDREQSKKYKPRPFKGEQLSEGDVKKILGELSQQDKKIRANYNKKERKEDRNDKDW